jgi:hypothetical protein
MCRIAEDWAQSPQRYQSQQSASGHLNTSVVQIFFAPKIRRERIFNERPGLGHFKPQNEKVRTLNIFIQACNSVESPLIKEAYFISSTNGGPSRISMVR